jgi:hypothetical protein
VTFPGSGHITNVWIYDGSTVIQEFNGLELAGIHRTSIDNSNRFALTKAHNVAFGIGISFQFAASTPIDGPTGMYLVQVASAGAEFNM